jgi:hypothetical protein
MIAYKEEKNIFKYISGRRKGKSLGDFSGERYELCLGVGWYGVRQLIYCYQVAVECGNLDSFSAFTFTVDRLSTVFFSYLPTCLGTYI